MDEAHFLVSDFPYPGLILEIDHVGGRAPTQEAIEYVVAALKEATAKKEIRVLGPTVQKVAGEDPLVGRRKWPSDAPKRLHEATFDSGEPWQYGSGGWAYIHVIYAGGEYKLGENESAGLAMRNVAFIFDGGLQGGADEDWAGLTERMVLLHEIGHTLGLVNAGAPMTVPRFVAPGHSTHRESVMWVGGDFVEAYLNPVQPRSDRFDEADLADLAALVEAARADYAR